jgi:hypothetical protein
VDKFADDLNRVLKYKRDRLPVSAIHPELRFTRLGAVLREHATEPSDVGELAYQALTSDHSQPLELMPLHLLRDKMQENPEHPLAGRFNWENVPEGVQMDAAFRKLVDEHNSSVDENHRITPLNVRSGRSMFPGNISRISHIRQQLHSMFPGTAPNDIDHSAIRNQLRNGRQFLNMDEEELHTHLSDDRAYNVSEQFPDRMTPPGYA